MFTRTLILSACLVLAAGLIGRASKTERVPAREALSTFPLQLGHWEGSPTEEFDQKVLAVLGVDDYVNRRYAAGPTTRANLYIGYYQSQREGDTIHSPLNCLPGAGWLPVEKERVAIPVREAARGDAATRPITVNRLVIAKGLEKQVVLYWYQSHGRVVASEYWSRLHNVLDAVRLNRTDAAIIRIVVPVYGQDEAAEQSAVQSATEFAQSVYPLLARYLPD